MGPFEFSFRGGITWYGFSSRGVPNTQLSDYTPDDMIPTQGRRTTPTEYPDRYNPALTSCVRTVDMWIAYCGNWRTPFVQVVWFLRIQAGPPYKRGHYRMCPGQGAPLDFASLEVASWVVPSVGRCLEVASRVVTSVGRCLEVASRVVTSVGRCLLAVASERYLDTRVQLVFASLVHRGYAASGKDTWTRVSNSSSLQRVGNVTASARVSFC